MIIHDRNANSIDEFPLDSEGKRAMPVLIQHTGFTVHLNVQNVTATTPFMLISLNGTDQWPHTETNIIHVDWLAININPTASYRGDIDLGFLSGTTATSGHFHVLKTYHFEQSASQVHAFLNFTGSHIEWSTDNWFGPLVSGDTTWGNSRKMLGPDGYLHFGSYNGDLVMKVGATAGNVDIGITIGYHTT